MSEKGLSLEAKELIRNYMVKIVTFPGIILTVVGFLLGFFLNDVAKTTAYNKAYEEASKIILGTTGEAAKASIKSQEVLKNVETLLAEAESLRAKLRTADAFQRSEEIVKQVADSLLDRSDFKHLIIQNTGSIHFFPSEKYIPLWKSKTGGPHAYNISRYVPKTAKGVLLKVIVISNKSESGSFVCADQEGKFSSENSEIWHHQQNGFSNYLKSWVGGVVFCPLTRDGTITWQMMSNEDFVGPTDKVRSWGTLIGWFK